MRVLHVIPSVSPAHGGPSRAIRLMERALANRVSVTTLTTDDDGPGRRLSHSSVSANDSEAARVYKAKWTEFYKIAPGVLPWLVDNARNFDVMHVHALFSFTSVVAAKVAAAYKVPYVIRPLGTLNRYGMRARRPLLKRATFALIESRILRHAAAVHCTSATELKEVEDLGIPFRGVVIPLGVEEIRRYGKARRLDAPGAKTILFLSRLDRVKNLESLLRAMALPGPSNAGLRLLVAGTGERSYVAELQDLARFLGLTERVEWLGHATEDVKEQAFGRADIFVQPSLSESFGLAAVEAMLAGVPCVLSDGVAIASEAGGAGAARICVKTPESISNAMMDLVHDDIEARSLGERGAAFARKNYSIESMGDKLIALYNGLKIGQPQ